MLFKKYGPQVLFQQTWVSIEIEDFKCLIKLSYNFLLVLAIGKLLSTVSLCVHLLKKVKLYHPIFFISVYF